MDIHETPSCGADKDRTGRNGGGEHRDHLYPNAIVVTGQRIDDSDNDEATYYHEAQIRYGPFRADAYLSTPIQPEMASAVYQNGFLRITLPRRTARRRPPGRYPTVRHEDGIPTTKTPVIAALSSWSPASQSIICEPATGRLTYSYPKETSHA